MTKFYDLSMTNFIFLFVINQAILQGTQITILYKHKRQRISTYALLRLILPIFSTFSVSSDSAMYSLSSAHCDTASSIARFTLPAFASIKSLHKKSAVSSADENDNLISSVSSESYTPLPRLSFSPIL